MRCVRFGTRIIRGKRYEIHRSDVRDSDISYESVQTMRVSNLKNNNKKKLYSYYTPIPSNVRKRGYKYGVFSKKVFTPKFAKFDTRCVLTTTRRQCGDPKNAVVPKCDHSIQGKVSLLFPSVLGKSISKTPLSRSLRR